MLKFIISQESPYRSIEKRQDTDIKYQIKDLRTYSDLLQKISFHSAIDSLLLQDNILLILVAYSYAMPKCQGFTFPGFQPQHISHIFSNSTIRHLPQLFQNTKIFMDKTSGMVKDITCGSLTISARNSFHNLMSSGKISSIFSMLFKEGPSEDISDEEINIIYQAISDNTKHVEISNIIENPVFFHICSTICFSNAPICEIPYYNQKLKDMDTNLFDSLLTLSDNVFINGFITDKNWKSTSIIINQLKPTVKDLFYSYLYQ